MKAMSQILLNDQQRMIMSLNKRTLLEERSSSDPMTETPDNSDGETVAQKLKQSLKYQGVLHKGQIDATEANRRAIISVTKRRFADEDVDQDAWNKNISSIIEEIQRKVYEDPVKAVR